MSRSEYYFLIGFQVSANPDYIVYHRQIMEVERLIAQGSYEEALTTYEQVFELYDFVFIRDYKVAAQ